jgi:hypothetical protein
MECSGQELTSSAEEAITRWKFINPNNTNLLLVMAFSRALVGTELNKQQHRQYIPGKQ